jgi:hypothetical protein
MRRIRETMNWIYYAIHNMNVDNRLQNYNISYQYQSTNTKYKVYK